MANPATFRAVHQDGTESRHTGELADVIRTIGAEDPELTFVVAPDGATIRVWARASEYRTHQPIITITLEPE